MSIPFIPGLNSVLNVKAIVGAFNQEKTLVGAFSVIVKSLPKIRGPSFEVLLQTLWTNYLQHGHAEYVSIQDLEFDVEEGDLQHLVSAGIVTQHKNDKDLIKLVDFTMST